MRWISPLSPNAAKKPCWSRCCWRSPAAISTPIPGSPTAFWPMPRRPISCSSGCNATAARWQQALSLRAAAVRLLGRRGDCRVAAPRCRRQGRSDQPLIEIGMLILVGILHNRDAPGLPARSASRWSPPCRPRSSPRSKGRLQLGDDHGQFPPGDRGRIRLVAGRQVGLLRKSWHLHGGCAPLSGRVRRGAFLTERMPTLTLTVPVFALLLVLLLAASAPG